MSLQLLKFAKEQTVTDINCGSAANNVAESKLYPRFSHIIGSSWIVFIFLYNF